MTIVLYSCHNLLVAACALTLLFVETYIAVGYQFNRDRAYMKDLIEGKIKPYAFHMNWNSDKATKIKFNQQLGDWFVKESCLGTRDSIDELTQAVSDDYCCTDNPVVVCHYRDKPSKIPCPESPMIESKTSFW